MAENITLDYVPDVNDSTEPKDGRSVMKGAEELRQIKAKLNQVSGGSFNKGSMLANAVIYAPRYRFGDKTYTSEALRNKMINQSLHNKTPNFLSIVTAGTTKLRLKASATFPVYMSARHGFSDGGYSDTLIKTVADIDTDIPANATELNNLYMNILAKTDANRLNIASVLMTHAKPIVDYDWPRYRGYRIDQLESVTLAGAVSFMDYFGNSVTASTVAATTQVKLGSDGKLWMWAAETAAAQYWRIGKDEDQNEVMASRVWTMGFDWYTDQAIVAGRIFLSFTLGATLKFRIYLAGGKFSYNANFTAAAAGTTTVTLNTKYTFRIVRVGYTYYFYVNNILDATVATNSMGPILAAGDSIHLGDSNAEAIGQPGSYYKNFYHLPYYVPAKPAGYAVDDLGYIDMPLFVDKGNGLTYKVTGRATPAAPFPVLTEELYSIIPLGFYNKYEAATPAAPLQLPYDFSMLENKLYVRGSVAAWDSDTVAVFGKVNISANTAQGIEIVQGSINGNIGTYPEIVFLYPSAIEIHEFTCANTVMISGTLTLMAEPVMLITPNTITLGSYSYNGANQTNYKFNFSAIQQLF